MKSKYVVGEMRTETGTAWAAVVFPEFVVHSDMARRMFYEVLSAGFVDVYADEKSEFGVGVRCYGRSESLKKGSEPERDEKLVRRCLSLEY